MEARSNRRSCFAIVLVLFLQTFFLMGTFKAIGVLLKDMSRTLETTAAVIGCGLGLVIAFNRLPSFLVVAIFRRVSRPRMMLLVGAILSSVGIMLLSTATHNIMLFIFLSAAGIGHAIQGICSVILLDEIAGERFNIYYSISMCGFSAAMVLFPLLAETLLDAYDWRAAILIMGSIMLNSVPAVMNIRVPPKDRLAVDDAASNPLAPSDIDMTIDEGVEGGTYIENALDTDESQLLMSPKEQDRPSHSVDEYNRLNPETKKDKFLHWFRQSDFYLDPVFNFIMLSYGFHEFVYSGWHAFLVPHCLQRGLSINRMVLVTSSAAIGNLAGRILVAFLTNGIMDPTNMYLAVTALDITALACDAFKIFPNFYVMLITTCCSAGALAGRAVLGPIILRERTSRGQFPAAICAFNFVAGCFSLLGGFSAGSIADRFSSFDATFKLLAVMDVLVFISILPPKLKKKHESAD